MLDTAGAADYGKLFRMVLWTVLVGALFFHIVRALQGSLPSTGDGVDAFWRYAPYRVLKGLNDIRVGLGNWIGSFVQNCSNDWYATCNSAAGGLKIIFGLHE